MMYLPWPKLLPYWAEEPIQSDWQITRTPATWEPDRRYADAKLNLSSLEFEQLYYCKWIELDKGDSI